MSISIFKYEDYRVFLKNYIEELPKRGHGFLSKLANFLNVNPAMLSHILNYKNDFSREHAYLVCEYIDLNEIETEYFLCMVDLEKAGSVKLKKFQKLKLTQIKEEGLKVSNRIDAEKFKFSDENRAIFYSNWHYSAVRLLTSIPEYRSREKILNYFDLPEEEVEKILQFLLETGLCVELENGDIKHGPLYTHLNNKESPFIINYHKSWRLKCLQRSSHISDEELRFTAPLTISNEDIPRVRELLIECFNTIKGMVQEKTPEQLVCLNIDWHKILK